MIVSSGVSARDVQSTPNDPRSAWTQSGTGKARLFISADGYA